MPRAIARILKLNASNINSSGMHTRREQETLNANPEVTNVRFVGSDDWRSLKEIAIERIGEQTIRKNAVLAVEILLTASPEYFRPDCPERAGYYESQRLIDWQKQVKTWLDNKYGDRIVRAELHLDESTPHIHAYLVPLDERGKLNCRGIFGGRQKLSQFQDSYAAAMASLGLERGVRGSRAKHTSVKQYYAAVNQISNTNLKEQTAQHQLSERHLAIKQRNELKHTVEFISQENKKLQQQLTHAHLQITAQKQEIDHWQAKDKDTVNNLRELSLNQVAYELGLVPDSKTKHKWRGGEQHTITINGGKFYDWRQMYGGGGAIDLVMYVNKMNFKSAVEWLTNCFGSATALNTVNRQIEEIIRAAPEQKFLPPPIAEEQWLKVKKYLTSNRKLPSGLVDRLHQQGLIYADQQQNLVFLRRSIETKKVTGANLRGTAKENNRFKGLVKGTRRSAGWFYFEQGEQFEDAVKRVVLVESAIDALSLAVLERTDSKKTLYISSDGAGNLPLDFLRQKEVVIAFDNDHAGKTMAQTVQAELPNAVRKTPKHKDWNEDLVNSFDWSIELERNKPFSPENGKGLNR